MTNLKQLKYTQFQANV